MAQTVASFVVDALIANGIDQLYCLPGVQNDDFFDALYDKQNQLRPVQTRHEQGAVYMALGAALATGRPQAFSVVPGPGFLNGTAALATAYGLNAPLLSLVGQIPLGAIGKGFGLLHEIPDQLGMLRGLTKQAERISGGDDAVAVVGGALAALTSGRPRPVGVEVPVNVWKSELGAAPGDLKFRGAPNAAVDGEQIDAAAAILAQAKAPMIVVGSGALNCSAAVTQLAEALSAPVLAFRTGRGVISHRHPLSIGLPVGHVLWAECDVVIGIGTRLQQQQMLWGVDENLKIIRIDIDQEEIDRFGTPTVGINADAAEAVAALLGAIEGEETLRPDWLATVAETKGRFDKVYAERLAPQMAWLDAIRAELPEDGILVDELTQVGYVARVAFPTYRPRTFLSTGYQGTLGWGIATALGAAHARPDVPVVSISGDGGALFAIGELASAVQHGIPLTAIIFNDNAFGNVRRFQIENYNNRPIASDLKSPDFVRLAESFGVEAMRAATPSELRAHLRRSLVSKAPTVIEVPVDEFPSPWDFIMLPKVRG